MAKQIFILGGGYGGVLTALTARKYIKPEEAAITVVNRVPYHQIVTELHRLAAGSASEKYVALPLEKIFKGNNINLMIDEVTSMDIEKKHLSFKSGLTASYDNLVIALGGETAFFGIPGLEEHSMTLKSVQEANHIRHHIEARIEQYAKTKNKADATIVVGGGGLTGIELIGELADKLPEVCASKGVDFADISLINVEAAPSILAGFPSELVDRAKESLSKRGVNFIIGVAVTEVQGNKITLKDGSTIEANTFVWTGGVTGNKLVAECGIEVNRGRATVNEFLQSTSHPGIFLAGDSAVVMGPERPYPPSAQLAWQMGENVGYNLFASMKGLPLKPFTFVNSGVLASLGRKDGIGTVGSTGIRLKGTPASLMKEASSIRYLSHINGLFSVVQ